MASFSDDWLLHRPGAAEFASLYFDQLDAIDRELLAQRAKHPVTSNTPHTDAEVNAALADNRRRLTAAFEGRWSELATVLAARGTHYGRAGASLRDWENVSQVTHRALNAAAARRYAGDPERLIAVLDVMSLFLDRSFCELAEAHEQAVVAQVQQWEAVFQAVEHGMCLLAGEARVITHANAAFMALYGLTRSDLGHRRVDSLFDEPALTAAKSAYSAQAAATGRATYESVHVNEDGTRFPVLIDAIRLPALAPNEYSWSLSVHDLTERKQIETLRKRSAELENETLRAREASRLKSEFLANMSHELRTPLNSILGFSELLFNGEVGTLATQQREFVGDIHTSGKHLLRLINDLLDLSKVEAGKMEFYPERVDLTALVGEVVGVLRGVTSKKQITCSMTVDDDVRHVDVDPGRLKQVLYNYLSNAIKFSAAGSEVQIRIAADLPGTFRVQVTDQGVGIAPADLPRLFVEFQQLDGDRGQAFHGTGLGLALTRRLVEAQGGTVGVQSVLGRGSVFHAALPTRASASSPLPAPRHIPSAQRGAPRVLVIDDDQADQDRIVAILVEAGYAVDTASTGAQAIRAVQQHQYDAVTLDLLLPDTDGLTLLEALRHRPGLHDVPVIVISVVGEHVTSAFLVHDVLVKPVQPERLLESLRRLQLAPRPDQPVLVVDDDHASARLMVQALTKLGYATEIAHDGIEALERARSAPPAAVVLDLDMPRLDGFGFLREFRANAEWAHVPVLVWTVLDLKREQLEALRASTLAIVPKDGTGGEGLLEIIRSHLGGVVG